MDKWSMIIIIFRQKKLFQKCLNGLNLDDIDHTPSVNRKITWNHWPIGKMQ